MALFTGSRLGPYLIAAQIGGVDRLRSPGMSANVGESRLPSPRSGFRETAPKLGEDKNRAEAGRRSEEGLIVIEKQLGTYRVLEKLAKAEWSELHRGTDTTRRRDVAIKVLLEALAQGARGGA